jgi:hypothetical protein
MHVRSIVGLLTALVCVPLFAHAADDAITRRDAFLFLWQGIMRPAMPVREAAFTDIPEGDSDELVFTYAKARGLLDDDDSAFHPQNPVQKGDSFVWLLRTRNVADAEDITRKTLPSFLEHYALAESGATMNVTLTRSELEDAARTLDTFLEREEHDVSLYAEQFHGDGTAFGETFDMYAMTAAHRTLPYNTLVEVTNVANGEKVIVRINDRGPYVDGRDMDLSLGAFTSIAERSKGHITATFRRLGDATLAPACGGNPGFQKRITRDVHLDRGVPHTLKLGDTITLSSQRFFVVRSVLYPDGSIERLERWFGPDEDPFTLKPSIPGIYTLRIGTASGRIREFQTRVFGCTGNS